MKISNLPKDKKKQLLKERVRKKGWKNPAAELSHLLNTHPTTPWKWLEGESWATSGSEPRVWQAVDLTGNEEIDPETLEILFESIGKRTKVVGFPENLTSEDKEVDELGETFKHIYRTTKHWIVREAMKQYMRALKELDKSTDQRGSGTA